MKVKIHKKHPVYLKLQDALSLYDKMQQPTEISYRKSDGNVIHCGSVWNYLNTMLSDYNREKSFTLDGWNISFTDLIHPDYRVREIIKAVDNFNDVELEHLDVVNIITTLDQYERTQYVMEQERL